MPGRATRGDDPRPCTGRPAAPLAGAASWFSGKYSQSLVTALESHGPGSTETETWFSFPRRAGERHLSAFAPLPLG